MKKRIHKGGGQADIFMVERVQTVVTEGRGSVGGGGERKEE